MSNIGGDIGSWDDGDEDEEIVQCYRCKTSVYWGDYYDAKGGFSRRLYTASNHRLHDCRAKPDADAFEVIDDGR